MTVIDVILKDIETHLFDDWLVEQLAERHHYSTFHFGRLFKRQVGQTLGEYVRLRRLSVSATLLRDGVDLLEVALMCGYQSQEAYTRAFKGLYHLPPRKYVKLMELMTNKEMIQMEEQHVEGWFLSGSHAGSYTLKTDSEIVHQGRSSGKISFTSDMEEAGMFGTMMQSIQATAYREKRIMVAGFLRTEAVERAAIWFRVDDVHGDPVQFDNMTNRGLTGDQDWTYCACVLDVPLEAASLHFGVLLEGSGTVWADSFICHEVQTSIPSTNQLPQEILPLHPTNLSFDVII